MRPASPDREQGQATVELALLLPLIAMLLMGVVQVGLIVRAQILLEEAARAGARAAAVSADPGAVSAAARATPGLDPDRMTVVVGPRGAPGSQVEVTVSLQPPSVLPLLGGRLSLPTQTAEAIMRVEQ